MQFSIGNIHYHIILQFSSLLENFLPIMLFSVTLHRRKRFAGRFILGVIACIGFHLLFALLRVHYDIFPIRITITILQYVSMLLFLFFCFQESTFTIVLSWCAGVATENIASRLFTLLLNLFGIDDRQSIALFGWDNLSLDWIVFYLFRIMIYAFLFYVFNHFERNSVDSKDGLFVTVLASFSTIIQSILYVFVLEAYKESHVLYIVIQFYSVIMWAFVLMLCANILFQSGYRREISLMEQVLHEERKQYQTIKANVDIINMKCHDLKHRFSELSDKLTDQEIQTLQEAINIYDSNIKTGNEVLDILLHEKQLICQQEGISLSCMAQGNLLSFMHTRHLYSLFNNALNNALEAVRRLDDPDKKCIGVTVSKKEDTIEISVYNYFSGELSIVNETMFSTKEDQNHHGFGIMSMRYIAQQYGGNLSTLIDGEIFTLQISIPYQKQKAQSSSFE